MSKLKCPICDGSGNHNWMNQDTCMNKPDIICDTCKGTGEITMKMVAERQMKIVAERQMRNYIPLPSDKRVIEMERAIEGGMDSEEAAKKFGFKITYKKE
jgi:hypothetical protein